MHPENLEFLAHNGSVQTPARRDNETPAWFLPHEAVPRRTPGPPSPLKHLPEKARWLPQENFPFVPSDPWPQALTSLLERLLKNACSCEPSSAPLRQTGTSYSPGVSLKDLKVIPLKWTQKEGYSSHGGEILTQPPCLICTHSALVIFHLNTHPPHAPSDSLILSLKHLSPLHKSEWNSAFPLQSVVTEWYLFSPL